MSLNIKDLQFFVNLPRLRFMTIKAQQKYSDKNISFWSDRIKKVSEKYFIVRENNKKSEGYHYHILMSLIDEKIKKSWYKKGVHYHIKELGDLSKKGNKKPLMTFPSSSEEQDIDFEIRAGIGPDDSLEDVLIKKQLLKLEMREISKGYHIKKKVHVNSIVNYMLKELSPPRMYVSYILRQG